MGDPLSEGRVLGWRFRVVASGFGGWVGRLAGLGARARIPKKSFACQTPQQCLPARPAVLAAKGRRSERKQLLRDAGSSIPGSNRDKTPRESAAAVHRSPAA